MLHRVYLANYVQRSVKYMIGEPFVSVSNLKPNDICDISLSWSSKKILNKHYHSSTHVS